MMGSVVVVVGSVVVVVVGSVGSGSVGDGDWGSNTVAAADAAAMVANGVYMCIYVCQ